MLYQISKGSMVEADAIKRTFTYEQIVRQSMLMQYENYADYVVNSG